MTEHINPFRPRKLKIVEPGWAGFNGTFGNIEFLDGVSAYPVPWLEQQRLGGIIRMESAEIEEVDIQIGPAAELLRMRPVSADSARAGAADTGVVINGEMRLAGASYSRAELEEIADKQGLMGLRAIGNGIGAKGRSINELINSILKQQGNLEEPEPVTA